MSNDAQLVLWLLGAAITITSGLIAAIYAALRSRDEKIEERLHGLFEDFQRHIESGANTGERLRANETEIANLKGEVYQLRDRWHDLRSETTRTLGQWHVNIIREIQRGYRGGPDDVDGPEPEQRRRRDQPK